MHCFNRKKEKGSLSAMLFIILPILMLSILISADPLYTLCTNDKNYTANSQFENNLKLLLHSLSSNIPRNDGFYNTSVGDNSNRVNGQALCRGDVSAEVCQSCTKNASQNILKNCMSEDAMIWYESCQVRYSYLMFFSLMQYTGKYPPQNERESFIPKPEQYRFRKVLAYLMENLTSKTEINSSKHMFGTGEIKFSESITIYGLSQCTRDISNDSCYDCFQYALKELEKCCFTRKGGIVVSRNCNIRFQLYRFHNDTSSSLLFYPSEAGGGGTWKTWELSLVCVAAFLLAIFIGSFTVYIRQRRRRQRDDRSEIAFLDGFANPITVTVTQAGELETSDELPFMDLATIRAATNDFADSNKLGQGGFGVVYKGVLPDGKEVAVKRLSRKSWQGLEELKNEVILIAKLQHRNLVRLLGCAVEGEEKLLLYEFMPNRSLDTFIFDSETRSQLNWEAYYNIIGGIARGLLYLHEDSRLKIIHRDLKPNNVLLDHEMVAKISDFGMARIFSENQNTNNTKRVVGTYGYMAPEYAMGGIFSIKSDVFSFGVILLEIISGKKNSGFYLTGQAQTLLAYAWRLWKEGKELEFVDPLLMECRAREEVVRCIHVGLLCVQEDPEDRPNMSAVVALLGSEPKSLPEPKQPAFAVGRGVVALEHDPSKADPTVNGLTVSAISPR